MERLTIRDKKGRAYFDDDGVLIRGANGTFHQKKDMTAHYIHDRFVALDKAIDRLAAYEDTGLEPEEVVDFQENYKIAISKFADYKAAEILRAEGNTPLPLEALREMDGEPVWVADLLIPDCSCYHFTQKIDGHVLLMEPRYYPAEDMMIPHYCADDENQGYGQTWLAYRRKPEKEK